ncbi:MAG: hypothetical protein ABII71_01590 [Candidatus Micrarchaeota archaeon]
MPARPVTFIAHIDRETGTLKVPKESLALLSSGLVRVTITSAAVANGRGKRSLTAEELMASKREIVRLRDEANMEFADIAGKLGIKESTAQTHYAEMKPIMDNHPHSVALFLSPGAMKAVRAWTREEHTHTDDLTSMMLHDRAWRIKLLSVEGIGGATIGEIEEFAKRRGADIGECEKRGGLTGLSLASIAAIEVALEKKGLKPSDIKADGILVGKLPPPAAIELREFLELERLGKRRYRTKNGLG